MKQSAAEILREYGPFPGVDHVHGVTYDGQLVWFASGEKLNAIDPASGTMLRSIDVAAHAGTAFDGRHLFQIAEDRIQKIDPKTGRVLATIPAPGGGRDSGLAWAEGTLWVAQYRDRKIHQIDPETGAVLRTIETNRFVTGVTWIDGELWHGTWDGDESDLTRVDPQTGEVLERLEMPNGTAVSGLESDGGDRFFCGGGWVVFFPRPNNRSGCWVSPALDPTYQRDEPSPGRDGELGISVAIRLDVRISLPLDLFRVMGTRYRRPTLSRDAISPAEKHQT
jgi:glutamine cyclotransferase